MPSVREIAKIAGVSSSTVSRALNNDPAVNERTRSRVMAAANSSGYAPAVGRLVTTNIGLVYVGGQTLTSTYDSALLAGIVRGLDEVRFDVVVVNLHRDKQSDESYSQFFRRKGLRGVIVRSTSSTRETCLAMAREGFPMIVVSERFDAEVDPINYIDCNSHPDSVRAVEYLISLGHRRIAFCTNSVPDGDHLDRLRGYEEALEANSIPVDPRFILRHQANLAGGATALKLIMSMHSRPTAAYFADPLLAVGAINAAHECGINVPRDLSIVGFDDADMRLSVYPPMTSVCQDAEELGFQAAQDLCRIVAGRQSDCVRCIQPTFFEVRGSTGRPPAETGGAVDSNGVAGGAS